MAARGSAPTELRGGRYGGEDRVPGGLRGGLKRGRRDLGMRAR